MAGRIGRLAHLLRTQPDYVFGRFLLVRSLYSVSRRRRQRGTVPKLAVSAIYRPENVDVPHGLSGLVTSDKPVTQHLQALNARSWSSGIQLLPQTVDALREFASHSPLSFKSSREAYTDVESLEALTEEQRGGIALALVRDGWKDATVQRIAGDEGILSVVREYLGYIPEHASIFFFWSFASSLSEAERVARDQTIHFHYDVDGYNFVYVSFYLVDTDRDSGAHVLIERTHIKKRLSHLLGKARLSDHEAAAAFGTEPIVTIEAPAGFGFFEDTSCYHKASVPVTHDRLMLQIRYQ